MKVSDYARERIKMLQASIPDPQMRDRDLSMLLDLHVGKGDETIAELIDAGEMFNELSAEQCILDWRKPLITGVDGEEDKVAWYFV
jgi:hypothetical protein